MSIQKLVNFKSTRIAIALVLGVLTAQGCRSQTPAVGVNGHEVSMSEFEEDLRGLLDAETIAANPDFSRNGRPAPALTAEWTNVVVARAVFVELLAKRGLEVSKDDLAAAAEQMDPALIKALPRRVAAMLSFQNAAFTLLSAALAEENPGADPNVDPAGLLVEKAIKSADVRIEPRYGIAWDSAAGQAVVVPIPEVQEGRGSRTSDLLTSPLGEVQG